MTEDNITALCTKCNVALDVENIDDDESPVRCPSCQTEFGKWGDVKVAMKDMIADKFKATPWINVSLREGDPVVAAVKAKSVMVQNLKGRQIEDVPFSGLVERLCQITLICCTAEETADHLSKDDLLNVLSQISEIGTEALVFSGATTDDINQVNQYLLSGMSAIIEPRK